MRPKLLPSPSPSTSTSEDVARSTPCDAPSVAAGAGAGAGATPPFVEGTEPTDAVLGGARFGASDGASAGADAVPDGYDEAGRASSASAPPPSPSPAFCSSSRSSSSTFCSSSTPSSISPPSSSPPPARQRDETRTSCASASCSAGGASMLSAATADAWPACSTADRSPLVSAIRAVPSSMRSFAIACSLGPPPSAEGVAVPRGRFSEEVRRRRCGDCATLPLIEVPLGTREPGRGCDTGGGMASTTEPGARLGEATGEARPAPCLLIMRIRLSLVIGLVR